VEYVPRLGGDEEIAAGLQRLARRAQEYRHGSFIMLVVGPVKSGKSTLVNLLAHRYVSPTDKLECTLRPTIISSVEAGAEPAIEIYSSKDESRKEKDLDLIIDKLRGIIEDDSELREHLTREAYPLSDENIENFIAPSYNRQDNSIITAITTPGSKMLTGTDAGKIFLADMPGFDGNRINLSGALYDAMSRRVDLILFVHSSVSAFNVTSNEYLDRLREYNGSVPVYLIHNIFDASWWHDDAQRRAEVERQSKSLNIGGDVSLSYTLKQYHVFSTSASFYKYGDVNPTKLRSHLDRTDITVSLNYAYTFSLFAIKNKENRKAFKQKWLEKAAKISEGFSE
jgi:GTPase SAR1 family protein